MDCTGMHVRNQNCTDDGAPAKGFWRHGSEEGCASGRSNCATLHSPSAEAVRHLLDTMGPGGGTLLTALCYGKQQRVPTPLKCDVGRDSGERTHGPLGQESRQRECPSDVQRARNTVPVAMPSQLG